MKYEFQDIPSCNMCSATGVKLKVHGKRLNQSQGFFPSKKKGITTSITKCADCGLIFPNPMPVPEDISQHYDVPPESYWKDNYFKIDKTYFKRQIDIAHSLLETSQIPKSLDIGTGIGKAMIAMKNSGMDAHGLEPSKPFRDYAINKMEIEPSHFQLAKIETAEYEPDTFDFITFGAVLEHLYDPANCIERCLNWLKPKGIIHIEVPSSAWLISKLINFTHQIRGTDYITNLSPMHAPYHIYEFNLKSFFQHGKRNNYSVVKHDIHVCKTYMPAIVSPAVTFFMRHTGSGMQLEVWLRKNE